MTGDAVWYEAAFVVGMTNALNVVADGLAGAMEPLDDHDLAAEAVALLAEVHAFYGEVPLPLRVVARDAGYLTDLWDAARRAFDDGRLPRRLKTAIAFAVSLTTRSAFGTPFHLRQLTRLGVGEGGLMELVGVAAGDFGFTLSLPAFSMLLFRDGCTSRSAMIPRSIPAKHLSVTNALISRSAKIFDVLSG